MRKFCAVSESNFSRRWRENLEALDSLLNNIACKTV